MRAGISKVCLSPYYTIPTQTFRYYPGYPYTTYLAKNSIIATSPNLCYCNSHCRTILCGTHLACPHHNIFHQLIILYSTHHLKSYPTEALNLHTYTQLSCQHYVFNPLQKQKYHTRFMLRSVTKSIEFVFFFVSAVQYFTGCCMVRCGAYM